MRAGVTLAASRRLIEPNPDATGLRRSWGAGWAKPRFNLESPSPPYRRGREGSRDAPPPETPGLHNAIGFWGCRRRGRANIASSQSPFVTGTTQCCLGQTLVCEPIEEKLGETLPQT